LSNITSDILALSFDSLSSPSIKLKLPAKLQGSHSLGWGVAWYPEDKQAAIVKKDPAARGKEIQMDSLADWNHYRSTLFFCKAQGAAKGYTHHETQPFSRSFAGCDWLFIHNGDLDKHKLAALMQDKSGFLEPLGKTDSEMAFCYLLAKVQEISARKLSDVPNETLLGWFHELDALGSADMYISDGVTFACFYGSQSERQLFYTRLIPPNNQFPFDSESLMLQMNDPRDAHRSSIIVTSSHFGTGEWCNMQPGQLLIIRNGDIIWDSLTQAAKEKPPKKTAVKTAPHKAVVNARSITQTPDGKTLTYRTFDIRHTTEYSYSSPVEHSTHTFRLQPLEDHLQGVVRTLFSISVDGEEIRYEDEFGNQCIYYTINTPYTHLKITTESQVKVFASPPDDYSLSRRMSSIPLVWMPWQRQMMMPYLLPPELPETELRELTDYAMSFVKRNDYNMVETLRDMNMSIYRDCKYVSGSTSLNTTPFEVYVARQGVCQDFANLLICLARLLSIPARYRMGYIYTGQDHENRIQSDASHAWVEIYIPYVGWRGFDPTNGCMVTQDHIRVACGRNYRDSTPTSGTIFKGGGKETLSVDVSIKETF
jgi:transglutaminase-like putative cysteine protease/predicted glutamine amidotransferase